MLHKWNTHYIIILGDIMKIKQYIENLSDFEFDFICEFINLRNSLSMTQQEMADQAGVLRDKIAKIEAGIYKKFS